MCVYLYNVYIYISGQKWSTADGVLKSHRSKIGLIYMCNHENNVPSGLSPQWLWTTHALRYMVYIMSPSLWVATKPLWWYPGGHIVFMIEYINIYIYIQRIQRMINTLNILHPRFMEQDESHPYFIFYWKLSKVTLDYIYELINLNHSLNLPFKFSLKTMKMDSFSILWQCTFKNSTHTFRSDTHAFLQSLSWRWMW